ncbi:hypothetical protein M4951_06180 [Blastopirellula sp. J2-11]|uniref:hypothetical protein n=1 Tax=Blastopirellula sp. J2-11 TaxID=2943192 RepID=UPI0021C57445|nr:hypothetical protein [Blastopirellula sp. J2-11]UUO07899.1 hypothetical protein M4951_06180 [Blastopirellula sp. J2-11]
MPIANSESEDRTFSREQFYEFVWSAPATKLAAELGCSDVMIGKVCLAYDVPKPYSGYWTKLACGKDVDKTPLPPRSEPELQRIVFHRHDAAHSPADESPADLRFDSDIMEALERARSLGPVKVNHSLQNPHKLVADAKTKHEHEAAVIKIPWLERTPQQRRRLEPTISINVSDACLGRALRLMDAFIKRLEAIGGGLVLDQNPQSKYAAETVVVIKGENVTKIRLREKNKQVRISDPNAKFDWDRNRTELVPTSILLFDDGPSSYHPPLAIDTRKKKIEEMLDDLVIELITRAGEQRIAQRIWQERERERRESERLRCEREAEIKRTQEELGKRQAAEQKRVDQLLQLAESWEKSKLIREFLEAIGDVYAAKSMAIPIDSEFARYLRWGFEQADRIDPLRHSPPSVLDEVVSESDLGDFSGSNSNSDSTA